MDLSIDSKTDELVYLRIDGDIRGRFPSDPTKLLTELLGKDAYKNRVLLSFEDVKYVDSNGLAWLVVCHKRFSEGGGALVLHTLPEVVRNVMKIVRLDQVFLLAENADEAGKIAMAQ